MGILSTNQAPSDTTEQMPPDQAQEGSAQDAFDKFVIEAMKIIHTPKVTNSLIKRMKSSTDTVEAIGSIAIDIVTRLDNSANESGFPLTANAVLNGINVIIGELINIAVAAGAKQLSDEQKYQAFSWAIAKYFEGAIKSGKMTPEQMKQVLSKINPEAMKQLPQAQPPAMPQGGQPQPMTQPPQQQPMPQGGM